MTLIEKPREPIVCMICIHCQVNDHGGCKVNNVTDMDSVHRSLPFIFGKTVNQ